jgi:uncharacterized membrane protein
MSTQIVAEMHWQQAELAELPIEKDFRMRGLETTRLDTLIDAAFAFVLSMLVISRGGIPETFQELLIGIKTIPALAMSFLVLMLFWLTHRKWSRRFGMETRNTIILSVGLVFALLVYVYPLRLLFEAMFNALTSGFLPINFTLDTEQEVRGFFAFYSCGFLVMSLLVVGLQYSALKQSEQLCLNEFEHSDTRYVLFQWLISSIIAIVSLTLTVLLPLELIGLAGYLYFSIFAVQLTLARLRSKRLRLLQE